MKSASKEIGPIVVVEDDEDDQFLIGKVFERMGVSSELIFFSNGKDALNFLNTNDREIFLILCDINMPVMNGIELRQIICNNDVLRKKAIPFIFLSTAARPFDIIRAYDLNVQGFFLKESTLSEMVESMQTIVNYWMKCRRPDVSLIE